MSALGIWRPFVQKTGHDGIRAYSQAVSCRVEHTVCRARWRNEQSNVARRSSTKYLATRRTAPAINGTLAHGESKL